MRKLLFISFLFSLLNSNISAQEITDQVTDTVETVKEKKFGLNTYYTPDIIRNELTVSMSSYGKTNPTNENISTNDSTNPKETVTLKNDSYFTGNINGTFNSYISTRKRVSTLEVSGDISVNNTSVTSEKTVKDTLNEITTNSKYNTSNSYQNIGISYINRFYNAKNKFLTLGSVGHFQSQGIKNTTGLNDVDSENSTDYTELYFAPCLGVGMGRIESVEDARQAIYIIDELSKKGVLKRELTEDEKFNLAQQISLIKNKRFFDSRIKQMEEISTIDSFFANNNLINNSDATYFTTLYDNWINGANFKRYSGQMTEICITPSGTWKNYNEVPNDSVWNKSSNKVFGGDLTLSYINEKPISLSFQQSITLKLDLFTQFLNVQNSHSSNVMESKTQKNNSSGSLYANYELGFYPNTRTHFSASLSQEAGILFDKEIGTGITTSGSGLFDSSVWGQNISLNTDLYFETEYYVSPQMRLSGSLIFSNDYSRAKEKDAPSVVTSNRLSAFFGLNLSYTFF